MVTLDALFWIAHVARDRALAAAEESVLAPALGTLLRRLETRLGAESHGAPGDLVAGFALARGVVSVARSLLSPAYHPPVDLARVVAAENVRIAEHKGPSVSPLLGVTVDYSLLVPRGGADASAARAAYARAVAWLGAAPFALAARGELEGAELSMAAARAHTRAALLIARLVEFEVDVEAAYAWYQWATLAVFMGGASDDVSLRDLLDAAGAAGMDVRNARAFVDVAKLDRLRHALARRPRRAAARRSGDRRGLRAGRATPDAKREFLRAATSMRLLPARGGADAEVLQALVFPSVGKLDARVADPPPSTARDGVRAMPRALDVAAWLGSADARELLRESSDDAYEGYPSALDALCARRPAEQARHDSVYSSSLDALATYLAPSTADREQPGASSAAWRRRRLEAALAGWTTLRHDALAFARFPLATKPRSGRSGRAAAGDASGLRRAAPRGDREAPLARAAGDARPAGDGAPAGGVVRLSASLPPRRSSWPTPSPSPVAKRTTKSRALPERESLRTPFRRAWPPSSKGSSPASAADASLAIDVHTDQVARSALVEACGDLDDLYLVVRVPHTGRLVLAVGATASHYEVTEPASERPTDATWRTRLHGSPPPTRALFTRAYIAPAAAEEPPDASVTD